MSDKQLPPIPHLDRFNPDLYTKEELRASLECNAHLLDDYRRGKERGGSMEWEDVDSTHQTILNNLPRLVEAMVPPDLDDQVVRAEPVFIERRSEFEYQVVNLPRNEAMWIQVENFDLQVKRTDEGIVVDLYDFDDQDRFESLASLSAFDSDTISMNVEGEMVSETDKNLESFKASLKEDQG